jgi:hypothetical protein
MLFVVEPASFIAQRKNRIFSQWFSQVTSFGNVGNSNISAGLDSLFPKSTRHGL